MRLAEFEGVWRIARSIDDRRDGQAGRLEGEARFLPEAQGLRYEEIGLLRFPGAPPMQARQSYLWRADGPEIAVFFADGRPFHRFAPDGESTAAHWCDPDQYDVTYDFSAWPCWTAIWTVEGLRKDYTMTTRFTRSN